MISIYLDANILILAFDRATAEGAYIWPVLHAVENGEFKATTSQITLSEVLPRPLMLRQVDLANLYEHLFKTKSIFEALPVTLDVLAEAARIRADRSAIQLPDAIHLATARLSACTAFLTADRRLLSFKSAAVVLPGPTCLVDLRNVVP